MKSVSKLLLACLACVIVGCSDTPPTKNLSDADRKADQDRAMEYQKQQEASQKEMQKSYQEKMKKGSGS